MKLTRKQFLGAAVAAISGTITPSLCGAVKEKRKIKLNGSSLKINKLVLKDNDYILGPGVVELTGPDAIVIQGRNVVLDSVSFKASIGPKKHSSAIRMLQGCENLTIKNCAFEGDAYCVLKADINSNKDGDLTFDKPVGPITFINNSCDGFSRHIYLSSVSRINIEGNFFKNSARDSIRLRQGVRKVLISKNTFDNVGKKTGESADAIDTYWSGEELIISSNIINNCAVHGLDLKGISPDGKGASSKVIVENNIINGCVFSGILVSSGKVHLKKKNKVADFIIKSNVIKNCNKNNKNPNDAAIFLRHGVQGCIISLNQISSSNGHGIVLGNFEEKAEQTKNITIAENQIVSKSGDCVRVFAADNVVLARNIFEYRKNKASVKLIKRYKSFELAKVLETDNLESVIDHET